MSYKLAFLPSARKEWDKLDNSIKHQFKTKLAERLLDPHIISARLSGMADCYKIKLRASGYRLVYRVDDHAITVIVVAVGKRENSKVYAQAKSRL
jgi:mRNA interferase RelE/StbE